MPYKKRFLSYYEDDATQIIDYLLAASPSAALRFMDALDNQINALAEMPYLYPKYEYDEFFRKMPINDWNYVVFYTVNDEQKEIIFYDILHMSRDISTHLKNKFGE